MRLWHIAEDWNTALDYRYSGQQWAASRHTGDLGNSRNWMTTIAWTGCCAGSWLQAWQLQLSVDNVLDENYETAVGFNAPQREVRVGCDLQQ